MDKSSTDDRSIEEILETSGVKSKFTIEPTDEEIVIGDESEPEITVEKEKPAAEPIEKKQMPAPPAQPEKQLNIAVLPLPEKIKNIASNYPMLNIFQIRKMLRHDKFGRTKIGLFKLYFTLRYLNLETVTKRYRFYRSF